MAALNFLLLTQLLFLDFSFEQMGLYWWINGQNNPKEEHGIRTHIVIAWNGEIQLDCKFHLAVYTLKFFQSSKKIVLLFIWIMDILHDNVLRCVWIMAVVNILARQALIQSSEA